MNFAKTAWKLIVAIKDLMVLLLLLAFFGLLYAGLRVARQVEQVPTSGALYLALDGPVVEQPSVVDRLDILTGTGGGTEYRLRDVVQAIETAAGDDHIKAVVLDLDGFGGGGQVSMERIGAALDKVKAAGKPILAHSSAYDDDAYLLAAHATEIWMTPIGVVGVTGPGGNNLYYKGLIEKAGASVHVYRAGRFKSAVEPYTRSDQSPEARQANEALVSAIWENWLANVAKARPKAKVSGYLGDLKGVLAKADGDLAKAAIDMGLVDKLGDEIAFGKRVVDLAGQAEDGGVGDFKTVSLRSYMRRHRPANDGRVAVITVAGDIVEGSAGPGTAGGYTVSNLIRDAMADDSVKAIVLRVDSPGGTVPASDDIRNALLEAKAQGMPVVASMANVAASGGYWVSTAADVIFAEPATITGSIGVFGIIPSFEGTLAKAGITTDGVQATPYSGEPDILGGISPEFDALAQASVDRTYRRFVTIVAESRKLSKERVDEIAQGHVWDGGTAHQLKLVDRFGGLEEAIAEAAKRAKLSGSEARPRYFEPSYDRFARLLSLFENDDEARFGPAAMAPRDLFALAARRQGLWASQLSYDLQLLTAGPSMRADCFECRPYGTLRPAPLKSSEAGWLALLANMTQAF